MGVSGTHQRECLTKVSHIRVSYPLTSRKCRTPALVVQDWKLS
jgi:hypothetical protein